MSKYQVKPDTVEAFQWTGGQGQTEDPEWFIEALNKNEAWFTNSGTPEVRICIKTPYGPWTVKPGDYIIWHRMGGIYAEPKEMFEKRYEPAEYMTKDMFDRELSNYMKRLFV